MRERHLAGLRLRRRVRTTIPAPDLTPVPDLLQRDFTAPAPNQRYVGDITYLPYDGGNLYLATVIDCYSRRLVGWSIADHMRTDLVSDALRAAQLQRGALPARSSTATTEPNTALEGLRHALPSSSGLPAQWARSGPVPTTPWPSRSTQPSSARRCKAPPAGTPPARPSRRVHLDHPLQHPPSTLLLRAPQPEHLREHQHARYAAPRCVTPKSRVQDQGSRPVASNARSMTGH